MTKSILFCFAHPDDEVGIISLANRYMREEQAITTLICTTNGDVGTIDPIYMEGYSSITERRLANSPAQLRPPDSPMSSPSTTAIAE